MTEQATRHYEDTRGYYNGSEGRWTICGEPWTDQPTGLVTDCIECARLRRERPSSTTSEWR